METIFSSTNSNLSIFFFRLLKLAEPVDITAGLITPACVPADNSDLFEDQDAV